MGQADRITHGFDLTLSVCEAVQKENIPFALSLYNGTDASLKKFVSFLSSHHPQLSVVSAIAPPFRKLTPEEDFSYTRQIKESGAKILFVGIGFPKQEKWMHAHLSTLPLVMLGIGAAFDFHTGSVKQAPRFMMNMGLEWFFRMCMEPRRLWKRFLWNNPRFIILFLWQLIFKSEN
jgi:N-acetylglucosaminyldiphosphoundecaprenol N-acetyl-beta-D-mannosaminyltransferase